MTEAEIDALLDGPEDDYNSCIIQLLVEGQYAVVTTIINRARARAAKPLISDPETEAHLDGFRTTYLEGIRDPGTVRRLDTAVADAERHRRKPQRS